MGPGQSSTKQNGGEEDSGQDDEKQSVTSKFLRVRIPSSMSASDHSDDDHSDNNNADRADISHIVADEIAGLPSPALVGSNNNNNSVFKYYNGQSPPQPAVLSRAPSRRVPSSGPDFAAVLNESSQTNQLPSPVLRNNTIPSNDNDGLLIIPKQRAAAVENIAAKSSKKLEPTSPPGRVYEAFDSDMRKSVWREVRMLGKGAFSKVLLATPNPRHMYPEYRSRYDQYKVAIKIVDMGNTDENSRDRIVEGLRREIDVVKTISHPSLIRLYAFNTDPNRALMVLPYCAGGDLFHFCSKFGERLDSKLIRRIFAELASATAYLHEHNIVHRDLKLENVLLNIPNDELLALDAPDLYQQPLVTLTDFGLSRKIDPGAPELTTRCGSEDYVPPELVMGQPYDGRHADTWALGVILYCMLEGRLPFDPPKVQTGGRVSSKTTHRIARVDWTWYEMKAEVGKNPDAWKGGMEIVEHCLKRKTRRWTSQQVRDHPWASLKIQLEDVKEADGLVKQLFKSEINS